MSEIKTLNGFPLADTTAREGVRKLTEEMAFKPEQYGLPMLYLNGDTSAMTKDVEVNLDYVYGERSGTCSVKWQGSSSLSWPKKIILLSLTPLLKS